MERGTKTDRGEHIQHTLNYVNYTEETNARVGHGIGQQVSAQLIGLMIPVDQLCQTLFLRVTIQARYLSYHVNNSLSGIPVSLIKAFYA